MRGIPPPNRDADIGVSAANALTAHQCEKIIELSEDSRTPQIKGRVQKPETNVIDINIRDVDVWVIHEDFSWVDELIISEIRGQNNEIFNFQINIVPISFIQIMHMQM